MKDKIEPYLDGHLNDEELAAFIELLEYDKELKNEVALRREINESIVDDDAYYLRHKLSHLIGKKTKKIVFIKTIPKIAAVLIIAISIITITNIPRPNQAFNTYYTPYLTDLNTRCPKEKTKGLGEAIMLYTNNEYQTAFQILENFNKENLDNTTALYYYGLCAIELNKYDIAEESLKTVVSHNNYAYKLHANWYLSMIYLKTDKSDKAKLILEKLAGTNNFYTEKAKKILKRYY